MSLIIATIVDHLSGAPLSGHTVLYAHVESGCHRGHVVDYHRSLLWLLLRHSQLLLTVLGKER